MPSVLSRRRRRTSRVIRSKQQKPCIIVGLLSYLKGALVNSMNNQDQALAKIHAYLDRVQPGQLAVLCGTAAAASESVTEGDLPYASPNQKSELCPEHYKPEVLALGWVFLQWICENRAEVNNLN